MVDFFGETILHADTAIIVLQYHNCGSCISFFYLVTLSLLWLFLICFLHFGSMRYIHQFDMCGSFLNEVLSSLFAGKKRWLWLWPLLYGFHNLMSDTRCLNRCCLSSTWFVICRVKSKTPNYFQSRSSAFPLMRKTSAHNLNLCLGVTEFIILRCSN